jgi:hypothetical protein
MEMSHRHLGKANVVVAGLVAEGLCREIIETAYPAA